MLMMFLLRLIVGLFIGDKVKIDASFFNMCIVHLPCVMGFGSVIVSQTQLGPHLRLKIANSPTVLELDMFLTSVLQ
jgi:hypothetical protein